MSPSHLSIYSAPWVHSQVYNRCLTVFIELMNYVSMGYLIIHHFLSISKYILNQEMGIGLHYITLQPQKQGVSFAPVISQSEATTMYG